MNHRPFDPEEDDEFGYGLDDNDRAPDEPRCVNCRCSETEPCEGGCIWATPALCSRCAC